MDACMMPRPVVLCTLIACHRDCPEQLRLQYRHHSQTPAEGCFLYLVQSHPDEGHSPHRRQVHRSCRSAKPGWTTDEDMIIPLFVDLASHPIHPERVTENRGNSAMRQQDACLWCFGYTAFWACDPHAPATSALAQHHCCAVQVS